MANLTTNTDLVNDVLLRAGELTSGSAWATQALIHYNRAYFDSWVYRAWPWTVSDPPTYINMIAPLTTITVTATLDSTSITWATGALTPSMAGRKILIGQAWYRINTHTSGASTAALRSAFQEANVTGSACIIYQDEYSVGATDLYRILNIFDAKDRVWLDGPVSMNEPSMLRQLFVPAQGRVTKYAELTDTKVLFNYYPDAQKRFEVRYQYIPADLALDTNAPSWPRLHRPLLSDRALYLLLKDKDDDKAQEALQSWQMGLEILEREYLGRGGKGYVRNVDPLI